MKEIGSIMAARWSGKQANTDGRMDCCCQTREPHQVTRKIAIQRLGTIVIWFFFFQFKTY